MLYGLKQEVHLNLYGPIIKTMGVNKHREVDSVRWRKYNPMSVSKCNRAGRESRPALQRTQGTVLCVDIICYAIA